MKALIEFFVRRSLLVNIASIMIVVVGGISIFMLQKEVFPNVSYDWIMVRTVYPGSSAEDVEKLVSIPIERQLRAVEGIKKIDSKSSEGSSVVFLEVEPGYDVDEVKIDIDSAIDLIDDFPDDAKEPFIKVLENKNRPIIKIALTDAREMKLREAAKNLRDHLENEVEGISTIELNGYREQIVDVALNPKKLKRYDVTVSEVTRAVKERNINLSAGKIKTEQGDYLIRTLSEFDTPEEIAQVVVRSNLEGRRILVKDLGEVKFALEDVDIEERANGEKAIYLNVKSLEKADVLNTSKALKNTTEKYLQKKYPDIDFEYIDDLSYYVDRRLSVLSRSGLQGIILVFLCLLAFLNFRVASVTSLGAPLAFMTAFALMDWIGVSINMISMFGLIMVLGMLVDDAIIVAEHFYQYVEKGISPKVAAITAAQETIKPVTATILTTIAAFGALFFMGGIMGKFVWPVPAVIIICLVASWLECFFILPSHLADFVKIKKHRVQKRRWYEPLREKYSQVLGFCLDHHKTTVLVFIILFGASLYTAFKMRFELFPSDDVTVMFVNVKGPTGTSFDRTAQVITQAENIAMKELKKDELELLRSVIGKQFRRGPEGSRSGSHYGSIILYLTLSDLRERKNDQIINDLLPRLKEGINDSYEISLEKARGGPPRGKPLSVELYGDELSRMENVATTLKEKLIKINGVKTVELDFEKGKKQYVVIIDDKEAQRLGLSTTAVAMELRRAYQGDAITEIRRSNEDIDIRVRLNEESRTSIEALSQIEILNRFGQRIDIDRVATLKQDEGVFTIQRENNKRVITVSGEINTKMTTSTEVNELAKPIIENVLKEYPTLSYKLGGELEDTQESVLDLAKAGSIALFCIFLILVAMFASLWKSFLIMSAIPFGLIGVVITFLIAGRPFGFMALMGIIGLIGVVVNDSIVLVTFITDKVVEEKEKVKQAITEGALSRFRPVILTTFTTVVGILPVAHDPSGDPFLKPMASAFAYGLLFASTITLLFVPSAYYSYTRLYERWSAWRHRRVNWQSLDSVDNLE